MKIPDIQHNKSFLKLAESAVRVPLPSNLDLVDSFPNNLVSNSISKINC